MRAGRLDRPITIETPVITQDITGQDISTWIPFHNTYGQIVPERGKEQYSSSGTHSHKQIKIVIRYKAGILPTMRFVLDGAAYRIISVTEIIRRKGTEIIGEAWL